MCRTSLVAQKTAGTLSRVRRSQIPRPYALAAVDIAAARQLLKDALPVAFDVVGVDRNARPMIASLLSSDYGYLEPHLNEYADRDRGADPRRPVLTVSGLTAGAPMSRATFYARSEELLEKLQDCAVALGLLLAARGDFCDTTVLRAFELDALVGDEAKGPGILGRHQRLFGIAIASGDMTIPLFLAVPFENMNASLLLEELTRMIGRIRRVAGLVKDFAARTDGESLRTIDLSVEMLNAYNPMSALLVPQLRLGPIQAVGGWFTPLTVPRLSTTAVADDYGLQHTVWEIDSSRLYGRPHDWTRIDPYELRRLFGYSRTFGLDLAAHEGHVAYWVRKDRTALHRRQLDAGAHEPGVRTEARKLTYALQNVGSSSLELARAIAYTEFLAANDHSMQCGARFASQLTPALVQAPRDSTRGVVRALRIIYNAALVAVGRQREADESENELLA